MQEGIYSVLGRPSAAGKCSRPAFGRMRFSAAATPRICSGSATNPARSAGREQFSAPCGRGRVHFSAGAAENTSPRPAGAAENTPISFEP